MSTTDASDPVRFTVPLKPSIHEKASREDVVGSPMRWQMGNDTMIEGIVVDWTDEPDGGVTLTVEASSPPE
ncbi:hypothetical protein ACFVSX_31975 [Streptomyces rubiginosohelvolus]|uniref:hypothetical protein n=1 Tax=Streptomyces rubiginosohelvolus TaxID=67362 RepID=UPI0036DF4A7C